jgi:hypothetical protein
MFTFRHVIAGIAVVAAGPGGEAHGRFGSITAG